MRKLARTRHRGREEQALVSYARRPKRVGRPHETGRLRDEIVPTPCYRGGHLPAGTVVAGPAIIEEPTTTVVLIPGSSATVTPLGNYLVDTMAT